MKSKKGFIITATVLGAITAASFAVWFIPQGSQSGIVMTDPGKELDALIDQQKAISESDIVEFDKMLAGQITPENYIAIVEISSSQIRAMIISVTEPNVGEEWQTSYYEIGNALRNYNTYLRETTVIAEKLKADPASDVSQDKAKLDQYLTQAQEAISASNNARPA